MKLIQDPAFAAWAEERGVAAVYAHGSVVNGRARLDSDLDVALLLKRGVSWELSLLQEAAQRLSPVTERELDLRVLNEAAPAFQFRVLRDRCLLFEGDRAQRIDFEQRLLSEYLDYRYYEDLLATAMRTRIAEGSYGRRKALRRATAD